jgi:hypothetical protein
MCACTVLAASSKHDERSPSPGPCPWPLAPYKGAHKPHKHKLCVVHKKSHTNKTHKNTNKNDAYNARAAQRRCMAAHGHGMERMRMHAAHTPCKHKRT